MEAGRARQLFGITLVGATPENGRKLLLTTAINVVVLLFSKVLRTELAATGNKAGDMITHGCSLWFDLNVFGRGLSFLSKAARTMSLTATRRVSAADVFNRLLPESAA